MLEAIAVDSPTKDRKQIMDKLLHELGLEKYKHISYYLTKATNEMDCFEDVFWIGRSGKNFLNSEALKMGQLVVGGKLIGSAGEDREALLGKEIVITDTLEYCKKDELAKIIKYYGGVVSNRLVFATSYVIIDNRMALDHATAMGVSHHIRHHGRAEIINSKELFQRLGFEPKDLGEIKKKIGI